MQIDQRVRLHGLLGSAALHGAVASLIVWRLATTVGAPTPTESRTVVMAVHLAADDARPAASDAAREAPTREAAKAIAPSALRHAPVAPDAVPATPAASSAPAGMSSAGTASAEAEGQARTDYESVLLAHLRNFFFYPDAARGRGLRGTVEVRLSLARDGQVLGAWVQTSSGESMLDEAALELVRRAQPMPVIPRVLPDHMDVYLPLEYLPPRLVIGRG